MAILANPAHSDGVVVRALSEPTRALLVAGQPLNEPIAQYGPFVMNTRDQLMQAVQDYQRGTLAA
jgi:quercetin 2,3-dioxygenase